MILYPKGMVGTCRTVDAPTAIPGVAWYEAQAAKDGLTYEFPAGALSGALFLTANVLAEGPDLAVFELVLQEGESGPAFTLAYGHCRRPKHACGCVRRRSCRTDGSFPAKVPGSNRWPAARVSTLPVSIGCRSAFSERAMRRSVGARPRSPPPWRSRRGSSHRAYPRERCSTRLDNQPSGSGPARRVASPSCGSGCADSSERPPARSGRQLFHPGVASRHVSWTASGSSLTHYDGTRWWLVDPDGHPFWSAGLDCVQVDTAAHYEGLERGLTWLPEKTGPFADIYTEKAGNRPMINYLTANFIRVFGEDWKIRWNTIAMAELRRLGFNTVGNWSDWKVASIARFPYVRPLDFEASTTPAVFRDFPDVFDPRFEQDAARTAQQLAETRTDPALIGYFLMNEPTWGFASETPAAGMLFNTRQCASRAALRDALAKKYATDAALSAAWAFP